MTDMDVLGREWILVAWLLDSDIMRYPSKH